MKTIYTICAGLLVWLIRGGEGLLATKIISPMSSQYFKLLPLIISIDIYNSLPLTSLNLTLNIIQIALLSTLFWVVWAVMCMCPTGPQQNFLRLIYMSWKVSKFFKICPNKSFLTLAKISRLNTASAQTSHNQDQNLVSVSGPHIRIRIRNSNSIFIRIQIRTSYKDQDQNHQDWDEN